MSFENSQSRTGADGAISSMQPEALENKSVVNGRPPTCPEQSAKADRRIVFKGAIKDRHSILSVNKHQQSVPCREGWGEGWGWGGAYDNPTSQQSDVAIVRQSTVRRSYTPTCQYSDVSIV